MMAVKSGKAIHFEEEKVRSMGRTAAGVRGIRLANDTDEVVGMICIEDTTSSVLVVAENGYGKRSAVEDYRITNRGGKGVKTINITDKTGPLISLKNVSDIDDLMVINKSGVTIRIGVDTLRVMGRATQGVKLIRLREDDSIASVAKVSKFEADEEELDTLETDENINSEQSENEELDSTLNDFVSGELERAIYECYISKKPEYILIEGQAALRNPSGPCGSEFLISANVDGVILQHSPKRMLYDGWEHVNAVMPSLDSEIKLIHSYGKEVIAITLNTQGMTDQEKLYHKKLIAQDLDIPVFLPIDEGLDGILEILQNQFYEN